MESPLIKEFAGFVNGRWTRGAGASSIDVTNPATGDLLASVPDMSGGDTRAALDAAAEAMKRDVSLETRREWLRGIARLLLENKSELARIITLEQGKPLKESAVEVEYAAGFFSFCANHIEDLK